MPTTTATEVPDLQLSDLQARLSVVSLERDELKRQLDWFKRELFGPRSERREIHPDQLELFESMLKSLGDAPEHYSGCRRR